MKKNKLIFIVVSSGLLGFALFFLMGFYNIAANNKHWMMTEWVLAIVRDASIDRESAGIAVPDNLEDPDYFVKAAGNYDAMCSACHLTPGTDKSEQELRTGLYPQSPDFTQPSEVDSARRFWVIKHGIKMTGMPAWGASHSDKATWKLVAFINQLPTLDRKRYLELVGKYGGSHMPGGGHNESDASPHGASNKSGHGGPEKNSLVKSESMDQGHGASSHGNNGSTQAPEPNPHGHNDTH